MCAPSLGACRGADERLAQEREGTRLHTQTSTVPDPQPPHKLWVLCSHVWTCGHPRVHPDTPAHRHMLHRQPAQQLHGVLCSSARG